VTGGSAPGSARPTTRTSPHGGTSGGAPGTRRVATRASGSHGEHDGGDHGD
jgi:hypothetical protein